MEKDMLAKNIAYEDGRDLTTESMEYSSILSKLKYSLDSNNNVKYLQVSEVAY